MDMTITNLSHFGLTIIGETRENVIFSGSLADCKRMAFAHGMEVDRYEGRTVSFDRCHATYTPADAKDFSCCWFKGSGLIMKCDGCYCLVMPLAKWTS